MDNHDESQEGAIKRGGIRHGAGRPRGENHFGTATFCLPKDVADILKQQKNRSAFIIKCIRTYVAYNMERIIETVSPAELTALVQRKTRRRRTVGEMKEQKKD